MRQDVGQPGALQEHFPGTVHHPEQRIDITRGSPRRRHVVERREHRAEHHQEDEHEDKQVDAANLGFSVVGQQRAQVADGQEENDGQEEKRRQRTGTGKPVHPPGNQQPTQQPVQQPAIPDSVKALLPDSVRAALDSLQAVNDSINEAMAKAENKKDLDYVHQASNVLYFGRVPGSPEVGDVRVTFEKIVPAKVTVMAVVDGDTFKPYKAKNGKRFQTLVMGKKSGDEIIDAEKEANNMMLWFFRIIGIMMVIGGLKGIFGFIETILKVVPFIAGIFGWGVGLVCTVIGVAWSLIVIAIAWLFYRPLLGISLLVLAGFLIWVFAFKGKDKLKELAAKRKQPQTVPQPTQEV